MEPIFESGIQIILFLQGIGDWLTFPMTIFTFLGDEEFYLLVMPALYWCLDTRLGFNIGLILMLSGSINNILKMAFHSPRPFWISTEVQVFREEISFGTPSGHAQNAVVVWGTLAASIHRRWIWAIAVALILSIGVSRMVLAIHFPLDVLIGWLVGMIVLWAFLTYRQSVTTWLSNQSASVKVFIALTISLLLILLGVISLITLGDWSIPENWIQTALINIPNSDPIEPLSLSGLITTAGALFGLATGYIIVSDRMGFDPGGVWWKRLLRYLIGVVGVIGIWAGLDALFPEGQTLLAYSLRYVRYCLVGVWVTGIAPELFMRLNLAKSKRALN
ncbi:MAG: phosphatase PAP2 family protein [Anaerolineales bacterium]|jgi:membrane-associated phospholipid phosphatase